MEIRDIMTTDFQSVTPSTTIQETAQLMRDLNLGLLPVLHGEKLIGTITDRDITVRAVAEGADIQSMPVESAMTEDVVYCYEDEGLDFAAKQMEEHQVRRLIIFNRSDEPVGLLSQADLARNPETASVAEEVLHDVSEPGPSHRPMKH